MSPRMLDSLQKIDPHHQNEITYHYYHFYYYYYYEHFSAQVNRLLTAGFRNFSGNRMFPKWEHTTVNG